MWGEHKGRNWHLFKKGHRESDLTSWERSEQQAQQQCSCPPLYLAFPKHTVLLSIAFLFPFLPICSLQFDPQYFPCIFTFSLSWFTCLTPFHLLPTNTCPCRFLNGPAELDDLWDALVLGGLTPSGAECLQARATPHEPYAVTGCFSALGLPSHSHGFTWEAFPNLRFLFPRFLPSFRGIFLSY